MSRLESLNQLRQMNPIARELAIEVHWRNLILEHGDVRSDVIRPWNGKTKGQLTRSCGRRLKYVVPVAAELSIQLPEEL